MTARIVVARFHEDLSWISDIISSLGRPAHVTVYDKSDSDDWDEAWSSSVDRRVVVENVGREAETFARFVVDNYAAWSSAPSAAADIVVFLQGNPFDHEAFRVVEGQVAWALQQPSSAGVLVLGKLIRDDGMGYPNHPGLPIARSYELLFGHARSNPTWTFPNGAQYVVPMSTLLARPLAFWKDLHAHLFEGRIDPWSMERLWACVFEFDT